MNCMACPGLPFPHLSIGEDNRVCLTRLGRVCACTKAEISVCTPRATAGSLSEQREWFWIGSLNSRSGLLLLIPICHMILVSRALVF